jgi:solute carrier family 25 protein 34/35
VGEGAVSGHRGRPGRGAGLAQFLIKTRLQAASPVFVARERHAYRGLWHGLSHVYATEGPRGLLRGVNGAVPRVVTGGTVQLLSYDACKRTCRAWLPGCQRASRCSSFSWPPSSSP